MTNHTIEQIHVAHAADPARELRTPGSFAVASVTQKDGRSGAFAVVELRDSTGQLTARCFNDGAVEALKAAGGAINCRLKISSYQGAISAIIQDFEAVELSREELLVFAGLDREKHALHTGQLEKWRDDVKLSPFGPVIENLLAGDAWDELCVAGGAVRMHHASPGGLAQHLFEVGRAGLAMLQSTGMDFDPAYFLAGLFAHDIGKLDTYSAPPTIAWTAHGQLAEHQVLSVFRLGKACAAAGVSPAIEARLIHIVEQAHGEHRHAQWQDPVGIEAKALACADQFSANLHPTDRERQAQGLLDDIS